MEPKQEPEEFTYTIFRTGMKHQRHYQVEKRFMGVIVDAYMVQLNGRGKFECTCPGFYRQNFPKVEHKHVQIAIDFSEAGEPNNLEYRIQGTGAKAQITRCIVK